MKKQQILSVIGVGLFTLGLASSADAATTVSITAFDSGTYNHLGYHSSAYKSIVTGPTTSHVGSNTFIYYDRGYSLFDLSSIQGTVTSASLSVYYNSFYSSEGAEQLNLASIGNTTLVQNDYATGSGLGFAIWKDLASGSSVGSTTINNQPSANISLNTGGLAYINGYVGSNFGLGLWCATCSDGGSTGTGPGGIYDYMVFDGLVGAGAATLTVTYEASVVPIPATVWLFGSGLLGLVGMARRKA